MEYIITIDGSAYLMHHGVKGMKWGVWNAETRQRHLGGGRRNAFSDPKKAGAKRHQESLRKLDKDLRNYTVAEQWLRMSNDAAKNEYVRGRISKKELNDYVNKNTAKKLDAVSSKRKELAKSLIDEVTATKKEGYHVTVRPTNFNPLVYPRGKEFKSTFKQLDKTYGRTKSTLSVPYSPASSGNYFEVKDPRTMTKKQKERATRSESVGKSGSLNSYRPQRIYYR